MKGYTRSRRKLDANAKKAAKWPQRKKTNGRSRTRPAPGPSANVAIFTVQFLDAALRRSRFVAGGSHRGSGVGEVKLRSRHILCQGMSNQLTLLGTRENHYDNMVRMYSNCSVVVDNLEVTYTLEHQNLSFLESIQEVGGYVLVAMNGARSVPLGNLKLIRGQNLYEGKYALLVMSNYMRNHSAAALNYTGGLRQLRLSNLTEILRGGVKVTRNPLLCNVDSIQWWDIVDKSSQPAVLLATDDFAGKCEPCHPACVNGSCWAAGPQQCQKFTKRSCAQQCSRRCRGPEPADCCNEHCAAGCTGPRATDCLACRLFNDDGTCKDACPPEKLYDLKTHQVISNPNAKFTYGATCVKACPRNYVVTGGSCVRTCGAGTFEVDDGGVQRCRTCDGACPKACDGVGVGALVNTIAVNASNIESFQNCTKINGDIFFIETSFTGVPADPGVAREPDVALRLREPGNHPREDHASATQPGRGSGPPPPLAGPAFPEGSQRRPSDPQGQPAALLHPQRAVDSPLPVVRPDRHPEKLGPPATLPRAEPHLRPSVLLRGLLGARARHVRFLPTL
ncbi:melanoma receptor tyrosine-protein kinase-like isoform X4 [Syngnathoides biaculeatus]|uniref:melanoma receptor tyrosine-protein kinase-like isoform X4 n=1 Tax=Syngnathoides biaculeatus TaxID=300417 RepID=UPI002ADDCA86|nr:melanoma receptor tyrosine-protein kinase-like isoform X4 [Syngnathoides biaculeatus]